MPGTLTQSQLLSLSSGISSSLTALQSRIDTGVLAETLPLVGNGLAAASTAGEMALNTTEALGGVLSSALTTLATAADKSATAVASAVKTALQTELYETVDVLVDVVDGVARMTVIAQKEASYLQDLASDLALTGLDVVADGVSTVNANFSYVLEFGTDAAGFFIDTGKATTDVILDLTVDGLSLTPGFELAGQSFDALDAGSEFTGLIAMDLKTEDGRLTAGEIATTQFDTSLDGSLDAKITVTTANQGDMTPPVSTGLKVNWDFNGVGLNPADNNAMFGDLPSVSFNTVTMDLGKFMEDFIGPLVEKLDALLEPLRPIVNLLTTSIGVLEDFPGMGNLLDATGDGRVTILDIMQYVMPSLDFSGFEKIVQLVDKVADWSGFLANTGFGAGNLVLGDFNIGEADIRLPDFDLTTVLGQFQNAADSLNSVVATMTGVGWTTVDAGSGQNGMQILQDILDDTIFDLPILTDPAQWMKLLLGQTADLVRVDLPEIVLGTDVTTPESLPLDPTIIATWPIFLGIYIDVIGAMQARINLDFGFDTRGLLDPLLNAIDGLYVVDSADTEIQVRASVGLQARLDALVVEVTGSGSIEGVINLDLNSGSTPGKLYFDEFVAALTSNPFTLFDASGSVTAGFSAAIDSIFGELWSWDSPRVTLGNFSFEGLAQSVPPNLAAKTGGVLTLHSGSLMGLRDTFANPLVQDEYMSLTRSANGATVVSLLGRVEEHTGINAIVGDGDAGNDQVLIARDLLVTLNFAGGAGNDVLAGGDLDDTLNGDAGDDGLYGGLGNDSLVGNQGNDILVGGEGADTIEGGQDTDRVSYDTSSAAVMIDFGRAIQTGGDAAGDQLSGIEIVDGSAFNDTLIGSQGLGSFFAAAGDDSLLSGADAQLLAGGDGNDTLESSGGSDTLVGGRGDDVYIVRSASTVLSENLLAEIAINGDSGYDWVRAFASVDLSSSDAHIEKISLLSGALDATGNSIANLILGNASNNILAGMQGDDTITGDQGDDNIDGGEGNDSLNGEQGSDTITAGAGDDKLYGEGGDDSLVGGAGNDLLQGAGGNDTLAGGTGDDSLNGGDGNDSVTGFEGNDVIYTGLGNDTILAGEDADRAYGEENDDLILGGAGDDTLDGADGNDTIDGEGDNDRISGGAGADSLTGGDGDDSITGADGMDTLIGGLGADRMEGGALADYYTADSLDVIYEDVGGGVDFVWATESVTLLAGQDVEIMSVFAYEGVDWSQAYLGGSPIEAFIQALLLGDAGTDPGATLIGNEFNQLMLGSTGHTNFFEGMDGADTIYGDTEHDTASYENSDAAVAINLSATSQVGGHAQGDQLHGIIRVYGSAFNDILLGENSLTGGFEWDNLFEGRAGDDLITGLGGNDTLRGDEGNDFIYGGEGADRIFGNEDNDHLDGGEGGDNIEGNHGNDSMVGGNGSDTLDGGAGNDTMDGGGSSDFYYVTSHDVLIDAAGADTLVAYEDYILAIGVEIEEMRAYQVGGDDVDDPINLVGNVFAQTLLGNTAANILQGMGGADTIDGKSGQDTASYLLSNAAVDVDLNRALQTGGHAEGDSLTSIENLRGSVFGDVLIGKSTATNSSLANNTHYGEAGNDRIEDSYGQNTLYGGLGDDTLVGSGALVGATARHSLLSGGTGNDSLSGGFADLAGGDTLVGGLGDDIYRVTGLFDVVSENHLNEIAVGVDGGHDTLILDAFGYNLNTATGAAIEDAILGGGTTITMNDLANLVSGNALANVINGLGGNDTLNGLGGVDLINGGSGNDQIDGGTGNDQMTGGTGDDSYVVNADSDNVIEAVNEGNDTVTASVTHVLAANVETLILSGTGAINGTGNATANRITGNGAANVLNGAFGADTLAGGAGNDTYVTDGSDTITEALIGGIDTVNSAGNFTLGLHVENLLLTGIFAVNGTGNTVANKITGNAAANILNGMLGVDTLEGGAGNDTYVTDGTDSLIEALLGGTDTVKSSANFTLAANFENLTLTGTANLYGIGNAAANKITGNAGNNTLAGTTGADTLIGGAGNDSYTIDGGDTIVEAVNAGRDTVHSSASYVLATGLENLFLTLSSNISGTGNKLANKIVGNIGNNSLNGLAGADTLSGGSGGDTFIFTAALTSVDVITDFNVAADTIKIDNAVFTGLAAGALSASAFAVNLTGKAADASDRVIYESDTGKLFFDKDGLGGAAGVQFAKLTPSLVMTSADIFVI